MCFIEQTYVVRVEVRLMPNSFYDSWANNGDLFGCTCKDLFPAVMESASNKIKVCLDVPVGMDIENDWAFFATSFDECEL